MDYEKVIAQLKAENTALKEQLKKAKTLAAVGVELSKKAKSPLKTLAAIEGDNFFKNGGLYYRGLENLSPREFVEKLETDKDWGYHFGSSTTTGTTTMADNPFDKNSPAYSLTRQMQLTKADPKLAAQLKAAAGS